MQSPFKRYQERIKQKQDGLRLAETTPYSPANSHDSQFNAKKNYDFYLAAINADLKELSDLPTLEARRHLKINTLIPKYEGYVQEYRASGFNFPNQVLGWFLVWLFDCNYFSTALELARFMVSQGQAMPSRFGSKTVPTFVNDFIKDWATAEQKAGRAIEPFVSELLTLLNTDPAWVIHEEPKAKLIKIKGIDLFNNKDYSGAIKLFNQALALYPKVGVITVLEQAQKELAKQTPVNGGSNPTIDATVNAAPLNDKQAEPTQANDKDETTTQVTAKAKPKKAKA